MAKAKEFKSNLQKPTDAQVFAATKGIPFRQCDHCGLRVTGDKVLCWECERLKEIGFGPIPRAFHTTPGQDTTPVQSYDAFDHSGYSDTAPKGGNLGSRERQ